MNKYIVIEGSDGTGKSTLSKLISYRIGATHVCEPYSIDEVSTSLRKFSLSKSYPHVTPIARELMMIANRSIGLEKVVKPALVNSHVVSDRSFISGMVYANMSGIPMKTWFEIAKLSGGILLPDIVVLCRAQTPKLKDNEDDIYDSKPISFHKTIDKEFFSALSFINSGLILKDFEIDLSNTAEENVIPILQFINRHL